MKETLTTIIKSLVTDESAISINEIEGEKTVTYEVRVAEGDMGLVIGRHGRIAKAIRTVMKSAAGTVGKKVNVEIR